MVKEGKLNWWKEVRKYWVVFLLFGLVSAAISAGVSTYVSNKVADKMQGDPCRIDFSKEKFPMSESTDFTLQYLFINLRDRELLIEDFENYCVWRTVEEQKQSETLPNVLIEQPITKEISAPQELDKFPASQSQIKTAYCRSPNQEGLYKIKVVAKTIEGSCEGDILMEVVSK